MNELVQVTRDSSIAVITINNPPVNALSPGVPEGIAEAIAQLDKDSSIIAIVLIGGGRTFVAGADIKEFQKITLGQPRGTALQNLLPKIEDCRKPIVMAIHGTAFGGGLELAMSGHYRVAIPSAQFAQPEVKLGLIPGAGGTQRLPRLTGVAQAVEMCVSGNSINAEEALRVGLIDQMMESDLLAGATAFARKVAATPATKTRERSDKLGNSAENGDIFASARRNARKKQRGLKAPLAAIEALEAATKFPFGEGCDIEQKLFSECLFSEQSKALIHVFFGEREVAKIPDVPKETPPIPINSAAVVGAGTMGGGIAMMLANAGIPVLLKEADQAALDRGLGIIRSNYANSVKRDRFSQQIAGERLELIKPTLTYDDFSKADIVIEAVFEGMTLAFANQA